jgi:hypothetical protein
MGFLLGFFACGALVRLSAYGVGLSLFSYHGGKEK